jgi:CubicO group peptidase (beta-lactamase class C family)
MQRVKSWTVFFCVIVVLLGSAAEPGLAQEPPRVTNDLIADFAATVETEMAYFHIPGVTIAMLQDGEIVYSEGFGVRNMETGEPFTPQTQFRIGSTTKSMTSMLVAQLVDEDKLSWDSLVTDLYPSFQTADPELTAKITVRDLMSMGTGMVSDPIRSLSWSVWTVDDLFATIADMEIGGEYREFYSYNNEVYAAAGYLATQTAGYEPTLDNYKSLMQERIFDPIGMPGAIITDDLNALSDNYATSYEMTLPGGTENPFPASPSAIHVIAPAGGVWTTIEDMSRYLLTQMNGGVTPDGAQLVSAENLGETWLPQVPMPTEEEAITDRAYAMGWVLETYRDIPIRYHDGGWEGYRTLMGVFPETNTGLIIFSNHIFGDYFNFMLLYDFAEKLYGLDALAIPEVHTMFEEIYGSLDEQLAGLPPIEVDPDVVANLVGVYEQGWTVELRDDNTLWLMHPGAQFLLQPVMPTMYVIANGAALGTPIQFQVEGDVVSLSLSAETNSLTITKID